MRASQDTIATDLESDVGGVKQLIKLPHRKLVIVGSGLRWILV